MPIVHPVKFNQDNPIESAPELTEEEKHALAQRMKAMDKLLAEAGKAKYKIELFFVHSRSTWKPTKGILTFWESGTKFHGGGDTSLKICPGKLLKRNECNAFIHDHEIGYGHCVCPSCGHVWRGDQVIEAHIGNYTMRTWSNIVYNYFCRLGHNCDIYLKHSPDKLHPAASPDAKWRAKDTLAKVRTDRILHIYPLANIIKDSASGSDTLNRFYAFLTS